MKGSEAEVRAARCLLLLRRAKKRAAKAPIKAMMTAAMIPPIAPPDKPEDGLASDVSAAEDAELVAAGVMLAVGVELVKDEVRLVAPGKLVGMDEENELMFDAAFVVVVVCFVLVGFFVVVDLLVDAG